MFAVIRRFFILGYATSRYTCARVSNPLIASREWPIDTRITTNDMRAQKVPLSQPKDSLVRCRFEGVGSGGNLAPPRIISVIGAQNSKITTMTVVICMIRKALWLDSGTPLVLLYQK